MSDAKTEAMTKLNEILAKLDWLAGKVDALAKPAPCAAPSGAQGGATFPPYGRSKGAPVVGASQGDLVFYRAGCARSLADASKARWHDKERALLAAIEAELARQYADAPPHTDNDAPPEESAPF